MPTGLKSSIIQDDSNSRVEKIRVLNEKILQTKESTFKFLVAAGIITKESKSQLKKAKK